MSELKPCPCCGSNHIGFATDEAEPGGRTACAQIMCQKCGMSTPVVYDRVDGHYVEYHATDAVLAIWNKRST